jgi:threonine dehydrogenase-like Zn-dependent dehydrogenase
MIRMMGGRFGRPGRPRSAPAARRARRRTRRPPAGAQIVVAGVCMETDRIEPSIAVTKEIELTFVLGYTPEEFAQTLRNLAEGAIDVSGLVTGKVGLSEVSGAFDSLADPEAHVKILVEPGR